MRTAIAALLPAILLCQTIPPARFDVVSIKLAPNLQGAHRTAGFRVSPGRIDYQFVSFSSLIVKAYPVAYYQVVWPLPPDPSRYDLTATMSPDTTKERLQLMLQTMLAERFHFSAHWETRPTLAYALRVADTGLKIQPSEHPPQDSRLIGPMSAADGWHVTSKPPKGLEKFGYADRSGYTLPQVCELFGNNLALPMVDVTGMEGYYDIDLFIPRGISAGENSRVPNDQDGWSDSAFFAALEKQAGLKVEKKTLLLRMLVIDHYDKMPTAN